MPAVGHRYPTGATASDTGVNFSLFSRSATRVRLLLFREATDREPYFEFELHPSRHRTFFFWHVFIEGARPGIYYAWKVDGPNDPSAGLSFDPDQELLDPWAHEVSDVLWNRRAQQRGEAASIRARVVDPHDYDWEGDRPLRRPLHESIIYEMHVRGFTRHLSSGVWHPGTFSGVIEKIPYLQSLGITDVELMPVMAYDVQDVPDSVHARGLSNYWGYAPYGFFAPHPRYAFGDDARTAFRDMVKALHRAGIGVILDVVLNHTSEGGAGGPVISFKGWGHEFFYFLDPNDRTVFRDFTGCGNTINCNHPLVAQFLLQCLEFWVREMHVDGFRLDLASVLSRGEDGAPMYHAPVLWNIEFSSVLEATHLIAEAWDAVGLHQVGDFPGFRWAEWNGRYRDVMRRFLKGDAGLIGEVATRIAGSSDLYAYGGHPTNSINFMTCHDGFTLLDLVSYNEKHNLANGEGNRDGSNDNHSWNSGHEGPSGDPRVERLRRQRAKNFMAMLMLSQGVPMILSGDEVLRTQGGNNNAYCQDNAMSWFDWSLVETNADMLRFTREMIALRKRHASLRRTHFIDAEPVDGPPELTWYGPDGELPDWHDPEARTLGFTLREASAADAPLHVQINMTGENVEFALPDCPRGRWHRLVDTSLASPEDIRTPDDAMAEEAGSYDLAPYSLTVFVGL